MWMKEREVRDRNVRDERLNVRGGVKEEEKKEKILQAAEKHTE